MGSRHRLRAAAIRVSAGRLGARPFTPIVLAGLLVVASSVVAGATITQGSKDKIIAAGPTSATHGFPSWYRDAGFVDTATGTAYDSVDIEPCIDPNDSFCLTEPLPDPDAPLSVATGNFHEEFFYSQAAANVAAGAVDLDWEGPSRAPGRTERSSTATRWSSGGSASAPRG